MSPRLKHIPNDDKLPEKVDIVVIGGGIIGACSTYFLAKQGLSVALIEKGKVGCEQSSRNWGWCRQFNRDPRELALAMISMRLWDQLSEDIGEDLGFRRCGLVYATDDEKLLSEWDAWHAIGKEFGVHSSTLSAAEANKKVEAHGRSWLGGIQSPTDGKAEPSLAAPTIADAARRHGAVILQNCAARELDITNGEITGVITEKGQIKTSKVLCAAGAWASMFCRHHGVNFPQASVRQTALRTSLAPNIGEVVYTEGCALTRRIDGSYTLAISGKAQVELTPQGLRYATHFMPMFLKRLKALEFGVGRSFIEGPEAINRWQADQVSPMEKVRILDPAASSKAVDNIMTRVKTLFPALAKVSVQESWGSFVDSTPDAVPVVSEVDQVKGLFIAAGSSGHGFGLGPGLARLASDLASGNSPCVDPVPFRLTRFTDGSKTRVGNI